MVRHACAEKRQRGRAARHSLRVRCGFFFLSPVMIAEKSHFTTHCHVCKTATVKAHPEQSSEEALVLSSTCLGPGHIYTRGERLNKMKTWWEGVRVRAPGQTLTASASLVANGLLIEVAMQPACLRENHPHPHGWGKVRSDHSTWEAVVLSSQSCQTRTNNSPVNHFFCSIFFISILLLSQRPTNLHQTQTEVKRFPLNSQSLQS